MQAVSTGGNLSRTYFDNLYVKNSSGDSLGYVRGTVQVYDIGRGIVNDREGYLFNMVTDVKAYPNTSSCVRTYSCSVNCRIQGHFIINTATLPSGVSYSRTLSLSGSLTLGTETEIGGPSAIILRGIIIPSHRLLQKAVPIPITSSGRLKPISRKWARLTDLHPMLQYSLHPATKDKEALFQI